MRVWEPHSCAGVNIFFENSQYLHNSLHEAPRCQKQKYLAIDNTPLCPGVHVAQPDQSAGHAKRKSQLALFSLNIVKNKHCYLLFVAYILLLGGGWGQSGISLRIA